jgi:chromate reductase
MCNRGEPEADMNHSILVVVGSLRRESFNRRLAGALEGLAPQSLRFERAQIGDLPLYNQDDDDHPAEPVKRLKRAIAAADGLLFVTPEYNRSIPGVLKNALDHASRPYGQNAWAKKPAGVIGASPGAPGTSMAQQHLRNVLAYLDVPTLGQPEAFIQVKDGFFDAQGGVASAESRAFLVKYMQRFAEWVAQHAAAPAELAGKPAGAGG